jgi:hypothetical protein
VTWPVAMAETVAAALAGAPGERDGAADREALVSADGEGAPVGSGVLPHASAVAEGPEGMDTAADGEAATVDEGRGVGEDVEDAPPHPSTRIATATAARRKPPKVALERRLIDSPIG